MFPLKVCGSKLYISKMGTLVNYINFLASSGIFFFFKSQPALTIQKRKREGFCPHLSNVQGDEGPGLRNVSNSQIWSQCRNQGRDSY
jgi:hypothetical protein